MFSRIRSPLENVLAAIVVFCHKPAGHDCVNGCNCQFNGNVETHEEVDTLVKTRLLELVLSLVHDQLAIVARVHH